MSKTEETKLAKGLMIRKFDGEIDTTPDEKDKTKKKIIKFVYDRIVFPWSRTGKDVEGKDVLGSIPSLSEVLAWCQANKLTTEFVLKGDSPDSQSVVGLLVDGINRFLNQTARLAAENTPELMVEKSIAVYAKGLSMSLTDAEKDLFGPTGFKGRLAK